MPLPRPAFYACLISALAAGPLYSIAATTAPVATRAEPKAKRTFTIAAADGAAAVEIFADQAGIPIIYLVQHVRGVKTNAIKGEFTPREALDRLVANTGLVVGEDAKTGALMINRPPRAEHAEQSPPPPSPRQEPKTTAEPSTPMNRNNLLTFLAAWLTLGFDPAQAQTAANASKPQDETITLSPFQVNASADTGYQATNTLEGSRLNTSLRDTPAPISIFTKEFLDDIGATDIESILRYDVNSEIVGDNSDHRGTGQGEGSGAIENGTTWRSRGLGGTASVNGFRMFANNADVYNVERVGSNRGPNAILFGSGAAGGILNFRTKSANLSRSSESVEYRFGSFDSARGTIDLNRALIKNKLGVRAMALVSHEEKGVPHVYTDKKGVTVAGNYRLAEATSLNLSFERNITSGTAAQAWGGILDEVSMFTTALQSGRVVWSQARERYEVAATGAAVGAESGVGNSARRLTLVYNEAGPNQPPIIWEGASRTANRTTRTTNATRFPGETFIVPEESVVPYNRVSASGESNHTVSAVSNFTATFNHRWFEKLYMELAFNTARQNSDAARNNASEFLRADLDYRLPDGTINPYSYRQGYYFMDPDQGFRHLRRHDNETLRAAFSYDLELGKYFGHHRLAVMGERHRNREVQFRAREQWAGAPYGGLPETDPNHVYRRRYFKIDGPYENYTIGHARNPHLPETITSRLVGPMETSWAPPNAGQVYDNKSTTDSGLFVMQSHLLKRRLVTTIGLRQDDYELRSPNQVRDAATQAWRVARPGDPGYAVSKVSEQGLRQSLGAVLHLNPTFSLTANTSTSVDLANNGSRRVLPFDLGPAPFKAKSRDYGIAFSFLENKITGAVRYFESRSDGEDTNSRVQQVFTDPNLNVLNSFATYFRQAGVTTFAASDPIRSLDELTQTPLISTANGYLSDNVSKGYEFETIANPTRNLTIRFGYSHSERKRTNVLNEGEGWWAERVALFGRLDTLYRQRTGLPSVMNRPIINANGSEGALTVAGRIADSDKQLADVRAAEERGFGNRPHKFNFFARYSFTSGPLKGLAVAPGARYQQKSLAGYNARTNTLLYGNDTFLADLMLQYKRKGLWKLRPEKVGVTYQVNIHNLLDNRDVVISSKLISSTGEVFLRRAWRETPRTAYFTLRLDF